MVSFIHKRAVKGDQITLCQQFIQRYIGHKIQCRILIFIIGNDIHAETMADSRHCRTDFTGSHDTGCFPVEIYSLHTTKTEVVFANSHIGFMNSPVGSQGQCHRVFCYSFRGISGHTHDFDSTCGRFLHIYIVKSRTAHQNQFHSTRRQDIDRFGSHITADKCTDRIVSFCQFCSTRNQFRFQVFDLNIRIVFCFCFKRLFIITFCIIK